MSALVKNKRLGENKTRSAERKEVKQRRLNPRMTYRPLDDAHMSPLQPTRRPPTALSVDRGSSLGRLHRRVEEGRWRVAFPLMCRDRPLQDAYRRRLAASHAAVELPADRWLSSRLSCRLIPTSLLVAADSDCILAAGCCGRQAPIGLTVGGHAGVEEQWGVLGTGRRVWWLLALARFWLDVLQLNSLSGNPTP